RHRRFVAAARSGDDPADRERTRTIETNLDRNLIGRTTDAARAHFERRRDVAERFVEDLQRFGLGLLLNGVERAIDDAFGGGLLAVIHQAVHELREDQIAIFGVGDDLAFVGAAA